MQNKITKIKKNISNGKLHIDNFMDNICDVEKSISNLAFAEYELDSALSEITNISRELEKNVANFATTDRTGGLIDFAGNGWLYMQLNSLLPNTRNNVGKKVLGNTITALLDHHHEHYGNLPQFDKVFVAIIEHHNGENIGIFDHDNKNFQPIPNALKGRIFQDDNQFQMSLGLFSTMNSVQNFTEIYVLPMSDIGVFAMNYLYNF